MGEKGTTPLLTLASTINTLSRIQSKQASSPLEDHKLTRNPHAKILYSYQVLIKYKQSKKTGVGHHNVLKETHLSEVKELCRWNLYSGSSRIESEGRELCKWNLKEGSPVDRI
jgi:hypothetical protein